MPIHIEDCDICKETINKVFYHLIILGEKKKISKKNIIKLENIL